MIRSLFLFGLLCASSRFNFVHAQTGDLPCTNSALQRDTCAHFSVEPLSDPPIPFTASVFTFTWVYNDALRTWSPQYDPTQATFTITSEYNVLNQNGELVPEGVVTSLPGTLDFLTLSPGISGTETQPSFSVNRNAFDPENENPVYRIEGVYADGFVPSTFEFRRVTNYVDQCQGKSIDQCRSYDLSTSYPSGVAPSGVERLTWKLDLTSNTWTLETDPNFPSSVLYYEGGRNDVDDVGNRGAINSLPSYVPVASLFFRPLYPRTNQQIYDAPNGLNFEISVVPDSNDNVLPLARVYNANIQSTGPGATRCPLNTPQQCLDKSPPKSIGEQRPDLSGCYYSYQYAQCYGATAAPDVCQAQSDFAGCLNAGCFFDNTLQSCFASLAQVSSIYECSYYSSLVGPTGDNDACAEHGCAYDSASRTCFTPVREGNSTQSQYSEYSSAVFFENPRVLPNSLTFEVDVVFPFVYSSQTSVYPSWPIIQVLSDVEGRISDYSTENSPTCSTYQFANGLMPAQFSTNAPLSTINSYLVQFVGLNNDLDFDTTPSSEVLKRSLGMPRIGNGTLVRSVSYDGAQFRFVVSQDLNALEAACGARRGVRRMVVSESNTRFTVPISMVEHRQSDAYTIATTTYDISIKTDGEVTIGATAAHRRRFVAKAITFPRLSCPPEHARMRVNYTIEVQQIFDRFLSLSAPSLDTKPIFNELPSIGNCYNDQIIAVEDTTCDRDRFTCTIAFAVESECRLLRPDGQTFQKCEYGPNDNRIATLGSDIPWPASLDGLHTIYALMKLCEGELECPFIYRDATMTPDVLQARIIASAYLGESTEENPFTVAAGFLPTPTSGINLLNTALTDTQEGPVKLFDGNIFSNQPLSVAIVLPSELRRLYDLRLQIDPNANILVYPLSAAGVREFPFGAVQQLNYQQFRNRLLYSVKNDFDNGCGVAQTCRKLPACTVDPTLIGCDGFSIPVSQLVALMPSPGYRFMLPYRIGLTNADGSPPNARLGTTPARRRLLSAPQDDANDASALQVHVPSSHMRQLLQLTQAGQQQQYVGTVSFSILINNNGTVVIESGSINLNLNSNSTPHKYEFGLALAMSAIPIIGGAFILYLFIHVYKKNCSKHA